MIRVFSTTIFGLVMFCLTVIAGVAMTVIGILTLPFALCYVFGKELLE